METRKTISEIKAEMIKTYNSIDTHDIKISKVEWMAKSLLQSLYLWKSIEDTQDVNRAISELNYIIEEDISVVNDLWRELSLAKTSEKRKLEILGKARITYEDMWLDLGLLLEKE